MSRIASTVADEDEDPALRHPLRRAAIAAAGSADFNLAVVAALVAYTVSLALHDPRQPVRRGSTAGRFARHCFLI